MFVLYRSEFLSRHLIQYLESEDPTTSWGVYLSLRLFVTSVASTILQMPHLYTSHFGSAATRGILSAMVMDKVPISPW